jgi:hypothetical protein
MADKIWNLREGIEALILAEREACAQIAETSHPFSSVGPDVARQIRNRKEALPPVSMLFRIF